MINMMYKEDERLKQTKNKLMNDASISKKNKETILTYLEELTGKGLSIGRVQKFCYYLTRIATILKKDFSKADKNDIVRILNEIERLKVRAGSRTGKPLSDWAKHDYRLVIKMFYKWLRQKEIEEYNKTHSAKKRSFGIREYPDEVNWFSISFPRSKRRKPRNLLKIEDVEKLVNSANNIRDKLFVRLLYETGARIGELLSLTLDGIEWDEHGATIQIFGKTGERKIRIIDSNPLLSAWLREHPDKNNDKALLFCGLHDNTPTYDYFRIMLHRIGKKTGIKKPTNPHHFRHSRATELSKFLTEAQLCQYMGWVAGSSQTATYVHLSGRDLDSAILRMKGVKIPKEIEDEKKQPITCPRCKTVNDSLAKWCIDCGLGLDVKTMMEFSEKKNKTAISAHETLLKQMKLMQEQINELKKNKK
jgi:integrase/recombinase XerD